MILNLVQNHPDRERDEEKCEAVFRPRPALMLEAITFYDFGLFNPKIIVI
jgi:hypothetical protein